MVARPVSDFDRAVAEVIRSTAGVRDINIGELARRCDIPLSTVRRAWHGTRSVSPGDLRTIFVIGLERELGSALDEAEERYQGLDLT